MVEVLAAALTASPFATAAAASLKDALRPGAPALPLGGMVSVFAQVCLD
jgi:hypothetical protein